MFQGPIVLVVGLGEAEKKSHGGRAKGLTGRSMARTRVSGARSDKERRGYATAIGATEAILVRQRARAIRVRR